jgi:SAM-dependent methyltransferase
VTSGAERPPSTNGRRLESDGIREEARRADLDAENRWRRYKFRYGLNLMFSEQNRLLLSNVGRAERMLEIGCGVGTFLTDATRAGQIGRACAVEVSLESARLASKASEGHAWIVLAPAELLPFREACFDSVVARGVLHHLSDVGAGISESQRVLRKGGKLVIFEGNPASKFRRILLGLADFLRIPHEDTQYRHLWPEEISELLSTFRETRAIAVNGMFAPLAYIGFGGSLSWRFMSAVRRHVTKLWPSGFAWWLLWTSDK